MPVFSSRTRIVATCLGLWLVLVSAPSTAAPADRYGIQRESFAKVLKLQRAGNHKLAAQLAPGHEDYPLYPYYSFADLRRRLHKFPVDEVERFLTTYDDSWLSTRLRKLWLEQLGSAKRWSDFLRFYRPSDNTELRCLQLHARLESGLTDGLLSAIRAVWLSAESLPKSCDRAFERLYASELMGDRLVVLTNSLGDEQQQTGIGAFSFAAADQH